MANAWRREDRNEQSSAKRLCVTSSLPVTLLRDLDGKDLFNSHEARAQQDAQQMLDTRSWGLPHLYDGQADLQKPPGYHWLVAGIGALRDGKVDALAVRLPATISATITILAIFHFLRSRQRASAAFFSAAILASAIHFTGMARVGRIDMPLTCAITVALLCMQSSSLWVQLCAAFPLACALLLKGPIGLVLPLTVWTTICLAERWNGSCSPRWLPSRAEFFACAGSGTPVVSVGECLNRRRVFPSLLLVSQLSAPLGAQPPSATTPGGLISRVLPSISYLGQRYFCRHSGSFARSNILKTDQEARFGLIWFAAVFAVLSCSSFKRADYLLPAYPGAAIFLARDLTHGSRCSVPDSADLPGPASIPF